jgi:predicted ATPase
MFTVKVRDFGPIEKGEVTLRPLTVLIGPNNAGKSYLALLTYALSRPFGVPSFLSYGDLQRTAEPVCRPT